MVIRYEAGCVVKGMIKGSTIVLHICITTLFITVFWEELAVPSQRRKVIAVMEFTDRSQEIVATF